MARAKTQTTKFAVASGELNVGCLNHLIRQKALSLTRSAAHSDECEGPLKKLESSSSLRGDVTFTILIVANETYCLPRVRRNRRLALTLGHPENSQAVRFRIQMILVTETSVRIECNNAVMCSLVMS